MRGSVRGPRERGEAAPDPLRQHRARAGRRQGVVTLIGLLLRADSDGSIGQEVVGGRVLYHERIRDALPATSRTTSGRSRCPGSRCPAAVRHRRVLPHPGVTAYDPASTPCRSPTSAPSWATAAPNRTRSACRGSRPRPPSGYPRGVSGSHGVLVRQALAHLGYPICVSARDVRHVVSSAVCQGARSCPGLLGHRPLVYAFVMWVTPARVASRVEAREPARDPTESRPPHPTRRSRGHGAWRVHRSPHPVRSHG